MGVAANLGDEKDPGGSAQAGSRECAVRSALLASEGCSLSARAVASFFLIAIKS